MRHEAIEVVCTQVRQDQAPPPHHSDVLGMSARLNIIISPVANFGNHPLGEQMIAVLICLAIVLT